MHRFISQKQDVDFVHRLWDFNVADFNTLVAETDTNADVTAPVAEWMSDIKTPSKIRSSKKACLLFDFHLYKDVFHRVSFEMIYLRAGTETVETKLLFSVSNDGVRNNVQDAFDFLLDHDIARYQVTNWTYRVFPYCFSLAVSR